MPTLAQNGVTTHMSLRMSDRLKRVITAACNQTTSSYSHFIATVSTAAAKQVLELNRSLLLLPEWFDADSDDRVPVSVTVLTEDVPALQRAAERMSIPHTLFMVWAAALYSVEKLGKREVNAILNGKSPKRRMKRGGPAEVDVDWSFTRRVPA